MLLIVKRVSRQIDELLVLFLSEKQPGCKRTRRIGLLAKSQEDAMQLLQ
jgi:hypothetical protein